MIRSGEFTAFAVVVADIGILVAEHPGGESGEIDARISVSLDLLDSVVPPPLLVARGIEDVPPEQRWEMASGRL